MFSLQAPSHVYGGHSSHVTNVTFLCDDSYVVSTGGKDMSVMQWRIVWETALKGQTLISKEEADRRDLKPEIAAQRGGLV